MKGIFGTLTVVFLVIAVATSVTLGLASWRINQEIEGWKNRAEVSSDPDDLLLYMTYAKEGMERWNMTSGSAALFFPTPDNDMGLIYRNVNQYIAQAEVLTGMDNTSPEYAMNLEQLSWSINRLELHAFDYYANHSGLLARIFCWVGWILFLVFGCIWLFLALEY